MNDIVLSPKVKYISESNSGMYLPSGHVFLKNPKFGCGFTTYLLENPEKMIIVTPFSEEYEKAIFSLTLNTFYYLYKKGDKGVGEASKIIVSYLDLQDFIEDNPEVNYPIIFENSEYIITSGLEFNSTVIDHLMNMPDIIFSYVLPEMGEILRNVSFLRDFSPVSIFWTGAKHRSPKIIFNPSENSDDIYYDLNEDQEICIGIQKLNSSRCIIVTDLSFNRIFSLTETIIPSYDNDPDNICFYYNPGCIIPPRVYWDESWKLLFEKKYGKSQLISLDPIRSYDCPIIIADSWSLWNFQIPPAKDIKVLLSTSFSSPKRKSFRDIFLLERVKSFSLSPIVVDPSYDESEVEDRRFNSIKDAMVMVSELNMVMKKDRKDKDYQNSLKDALLEDASKGEFIKMFRDDQDDVIFKVLEFKLATRKWELGI